MQGVIYHIKMVPDNKPVATSYNLQFPINYSILLLHAWEFLFLGPHSSMQSATDSFNQEIPFSTLFYLGVLIQDICEMYVSNVQSPSPYIIIKEYLKLVTGLRVYYLHQLRLKMANS